MNLLGPIQDIMQVDLITVSPETTFLEVGQLFKNNKIHHLPVVQGRRLVGMISRSDYLLFKRGFQQPQENNRADLFRLKTVKVSEVMVTGVVTLEPQDKINIALEIFNANLFHAIPIVKRGKLVGLVTTYDIIHRISEDQVVDKKYTRAC